MAKAFVVRVVTAMVVSFGLSNVPAKAQTVTGTIQGTVTDTSGAVLPGVTVTVRNAETGAQRVVITNEAGIYTAPFVQIGTYVVSASLTIDTTSTTPYVRLSATGVSLALGPASLSASIDVEAVGESLDADGLKAIRLATVHLLSVANILERTEKARREMEGLTDEQRVDLIKARVQAELAAAGTAG